MKFINALVFALIFAISSYALGNTDMNLQQQLMCLFPVGFLVYAYALSDTLYVSPVLIFGIVGFLLGLTISMFWMSDRRFAKRFLVIALLLNSCGFPIFAIIRVLQSD